MQEYQVKVYTNRTEWFQNGRLHRLDGPAVEWNGDRFWYQNGRLHRTDGPACEYLDGDKCWYQNGKLHREDGPAIEWTDGAAGWYLHHDFLGSNVEGFWNLWNRLKSEQQNNLNLHRWMAKYT